MRILSYSFWAVVLICASCSSSSEKENSDEKAIPFDVFKGFPKMQFESIYLDMETAAAITALESSDFKKVQESQTHYLRAQDSTEIVLPDEQKVRVLKIFLRSEKYVSDPNELRNFFSKQAQKSSGSADFSVYEFETETQRFKLNVFVQADFIRITSTLIHRG
mgnify:CR=1 FL=1